MKYINKLLTLILIFLVVIILNKKSPTFNKILHEDILSNNFPFFKIKAIYNKYLGKIIPLDNMYDIPVYSDVLTYNNINELDNMIEVITDDSYLVPVIESGIVTFIGDKDGYNTIIIEGDNTIRYSNISSNLKLYDKVDKGSILGEVIGDKLYLVFKKDGAYIDYKDFI